MSMLRNVTVGHSKTIESALSGFLESLKFKIGSRKLTLETYSSFPDEGRLGGVLIPTLPNQGGSLRKCAFTLAEVLITLGIIGVVAAITMPILIANINERTNSERHANIAMKVTQAMEQMRAHGLLNNTYPTTEAFVDELQKYLKIAKRCDSSHIADCWPTATVIDASGEEFEVSKAKTGKNLSLATTTNNVGLVLADGASMILNYNPSEAFTLDVGDGITAYKKSLPIGGGKEKEFAYSTNVTGSIDFVTDVNGAKGPNKEKSDKYYDIRNLRGARFAKGCVGTEVDGVGCVFVDISKKRYVDEAKALCSSMDMELPDRDTLELIFQKSSKYPTLPQYGSGYDFNSSSKCDKYNYAKVAFWRGTANCNPNSGHTMCVSK